MKGITKIMNKNKFFKYLKENKFLYFYGYMYGHPYINTSKGYKKDKIIKIPIDDLYKITDTGLIYIWGWPGPDCNIYDFSDYNITWSFYKENIKNITPDKYEAYLKQKKGKN